MDVIRTCHCNDRILRLNRSRKLRKISVGFEPKTPAIMMSVASVARMVGAQFPNYRKIDDLRFAKRSASGRTFLGLACQRRQSSSGRFFRFRQA